MLELFLNSSVMGNVKEALGGRATDNTQAPATGMETKGTAAKPAWRFTFVGAIDQRV
jgi:hypothetical protein